MSLAAVVAIHGLVVLALLALPAVRERIAAVATPIEVRMVADVPTPARRTAPIPAPVMQSPPTISLSIPVISITADAPSPPAAAPLVAETRTMQASEASAPLHASVVPPRYDMAYLRNPAPVYPSLSRRLKEHGRVMLRVLVSAAGEAQEVEVRDSSGSERLDRAAVEAVRRWKFVPAFRGSEAITAYAIVPILFALDT
jgi:protein TonB